jgi:hypothetical protein
MMAGRDDGLELQFRFTGYGNGVSYGTAKLRALVDRHDGNVWTGQGLKIGDAKGAGELVQQQWRSELQSRKPRDVMHLVMSARAGTDIDAFHAAARAFLAAEFAEHRYVFARHDPGHDPKGEIQGGKRPHIHVHAIIAMRSEYGDRIETSIASFRRWREGLAEHSRAHGIRMEMTDRRELATAPAYTRAQVRATAYKGRTQYVGTSPAATMRYETKREELAAVAATIKSRSHAFAAQAEWATLAETATNASARSFAETQSGRLTVVLEERRQELGKPNDRVVAKGDLRTELMTLSRLVEVHDMVAMTRSEFQAYEKRVEMALARAQLLTPDAEQRHLFDEIAIAARDHVEVRREIMERSEHKEAHAGVAPSARLANEAPVSAGKARGSQRLVDVERVNTIDTSKRNEEPASHDTQQRLPERQPSMRNWSFAPPVGRETVGLDGPAVAAATDVDLEKTGDRQEKSSDRFPATRPNRDDLEKPHQAPELDAAEANGSRKNGKDAVGQKVKPTDRSTIETLRDRDEQAR